LQTETHSHGSEISALFQAAKTDEGVLKQIEKKVESLLRERVEDRRERKRAERRWRRRRRRREWVRQNAVPGDPPKGEQGTPDLQTAVDQRQSNIEDVDPPDDRTRQEEDRVHGATSETGPIILQESEVLVVQDGLLKQGTGRQAPRLARAFAKRVNDWKGSERKNAMPKPEPRPDLSSDKVRIRTDNRNSKWFGSHGIPIELF
jgi:hypothetical protein